MAFPPAELLFEHLLMLRDAEDPTHPRHDRSWREVERWLSQAYPGHTQEAADARQEAMVSLFRSIRTMRAEGPAQAAKWVSTIVRRKRVDGIRVSARDPVRSALRTQPGGAAEGPPLVERVVEAAPDDDAAERVSRAVAAALEHVRDELDATVANPAKRLLRATQARATLLRVVYEEDADAIASALGQGETVARDRVYKWVERGRPIVLAGLERWERTLRDDDERDEVSPVIEVLRELVEERRADAGVPRPGRRKGGDGGKA